MKQSLKENSSFFTFNVLTIKYVYISYTCTLIIEFPCSIIVSLSSPNRDFLFLIFHLFVVFCKYMYINSFAFSLFVWFYFKRFFFTLLIYVHSEFLML